MKQKIRKVNFNSRVRSTTKVWRYIDFSSFIALLESKTLHFSHVSAFEDKYDGVFNCLNDDDHYGIREGKLIRLDATTLEASSAGDSAKIKDIVRLYHQEILAATGVNCWRLDNYESHAMWRVFLKSDAGVAIESTMGDLTRSLLPGEYRLVLGKVKYIDYTKEKIPIGYLMNSFFYKNRYFEHEKELRLVCYKLDKSRAAKDKMERYFPLPSSGVELPVDIFSLVKGIYVSPYAPTWFSDLVKKVVMRYELEVPVYPSAIELRRS